MTYRTKAYDTSEGRRTLRQLWNWCGSTTEGWGNRSSAVMCTSRRHRSLEERSKETIEAQSKSGTYVYCGSRADMREWEKKQEKQRRETINRSRKWCNIIKRHVAREYPLRRIHIAKRYSSHATMHLPPRLRVCLSRTGGFTMENVNPPSRGEEDITYRLLG